MTFTIGRMSVVTLVIYFIVYLGVHIFIAITEKRLRREIDDGHDDEEKVTNHKIVNFLNKWFPAIYVVFLVVVLYFG